MPPFYFRFMLPLPASRPISAHQKTVYRKNERYKRQPYTVIHTVTGEYHAQKSVNDGPCTFYDNSTIKLYEYSYTIKKERVVKP